MHSKIESAAAPLVATAQHTIIIKASKLKCKKEREKVEYTYANASAKDYCTMLAAVMDI